jgi:hypothetical protein
MSTCCEVLNINGVNCHETGCTEAWKDAEVPCAWCDTQFQPEERGQRLCSADCFEAYYG